MNNTVAVFDFDGTLTTKDTLFDFIKFCFGSANLYKGLLLISPVLILYKLKILTNEKAKEMMFSHFFSGMEIGKFEAFSLGYANRIDLISNPPAINKLKWHQENNHSVVIVSASAENWITPWANTKGITMVIGTQLQVLNGKLTGKFSSKNCYGIEKVNRLKVAFPQIESFEVYAYGDSSGDKQLLALSKYPFYKTF